MYDDADERDAFRDRCGVVGLYGDPEASRLTYLGLYALQHRGQESAGIVAGDGEALSRKVGVGLVADVFDEPSLDALKGDVAIGHVRYATAGEGGSLRDAAPLLVRCAGGPIAVAHNGNLVNDAALRARLEGEGSIFQTGTDTEVICHLVAKSRKEGLLARLLDVLSQVRGAYSLTVMGDGALYGARDPSGVRPLALGRLARGGWVLASETCAFDLIEATHVRDIEPGEIVRIDDHGVHSHRITNGDKLPVAQCIFEHVYFARPDSHIFGRSVHAARVALGKMLARECPADADVVIPVPDSGVYAAMGYAEQAGIPFAMGLVRNHYVGRTFIEPEQRIRHFGVRLKLNPVREILAGKRVVVVDDSLVRGTTSKKIVAMVRAAGATEVHMRISAPATTHSCYYGIDTPSREELIASRFSTDEIAAHLLADSLGYLSRDGLRAAVEGSENAVPPTIRAPWCDACFSGEYPIAIDVHRARARGTGELASVS
ncbi:MAG: amidophosphoribosyltransferase [Myxococcota bacterium]